MAKLKRLARLNDGIVNIVEPVTEEELLDRQLHYPLMKLQQFSRKFSSPYRPVEFDFEGQLKTIENTIIVPIHFVIGSANLKRNTSQR
ncbi:hypothetical protein [Thermaerobacillus caldiproteolyticus]|uniref:Uncharacterized protein n=1 Tax=Thermaerobacillus caldiproteolyticus TaxID=247480 RepID=A0A7V9ZAA5_9BACL|nr:hypothetical protein [Anoxybacillus caldiproteolyticus]MBA2876854.1 hypothetical protein [Anoxybacillus caldiproteolyticus]QPA31227.1 hypothetical protein ISX45_17455 [Anoxybacillus caldiproteolyticus]